MKDGFERREALLKEQDILAKKISALDKKLEELKFTYEQYFIGLERREPLKLKDEVKEMIRNLSNTYIKSTAVKFKLKALISKHNSYSKLWDRIIREIEEGRYKRDVFRLKIKDWQKTKKQKDTAAKNKKSDPIELLFNKYLDSRKKFGESTEGITKDKFSKTINTQMKQIKDKFKCKSVSFKIIVEKGKTKLKALPNK